VLRGGALVGIVSRADLMRALARSLPERRPVASGDADLRRQVLAELDRQVWAPLAGVQVRVVDGAVHFSGTITDERERQALRVAAEGVPGVASVHDHLCWIEPVSGWVIDRGRDD
jgi:osmotically-inducible protein OsmY